MLRKLLALGLLGAMLLGMVSGGALAAGNTTYSSYQNAQEDPNYWRDALHGGMAGQSAYENSVTATLLAASGATSYSQVSPRQVSGEVIRPGIDVSEWQGNIDWAAVAASGVEFAIIRAAWRGTGSGTLSEDSKFVQNIEGAKANGLKVGVYIFSQAITVEEGIEEARYLMNCVQGYGIDLPLVLDYEYSGGSSGRLYAARLSRQTATDICNAFCAEVEANGYQAMVYANPYMLSNQLYREQMGRLWLAHYTGQTDYAGDYDFWQFSSNGSISGISGAVDLNFWFDKALPFWDVETNQWFYHGVNWAYEQKIIIGLTTTEFGPTQTAERGQVITMIHRMLKEPASDGEMAYEDLTEAYYQEAIRWGTNAGIVNGSGDTTFSPANSAERQMLVTMLHRLCGEPESTYDLSAYQDADRVGEYARAAMAWAVENRIIEGYNNEGILTLKPEQACNRAEVATVLERYMEYQAQQPDEPDEPSEPETPEQSEEPEQQPEQPEEPEVQPEEPAQPQEPEVQPEEPAPDTSEPSADEPVEIDPPASEQQPESL